MKISRKTKVYLALQEFSWLLLGVSIFFFLLGLLYMVAEAQMSKLICQRTQPIEWTCELTRVNFLGQTSTRKWQLSEIQGMEFYDDISQIHIITAEGKIRLMPFYEGGGRSGNKWRKIFVFNEMTEFFEDTRKKTLTIEEDYRAPGYFSGFLFIGGSLFIVIRRLVEINTTRLGRVLKRKK